MPVIYVIRQCSTYAPMLEEWLQEATTTAREDAELAEWEVRVLLANEHNSFAFLDVYSLVAETMGPVLILGSLKQSAIAGLLSKLRLRCTVLHRPDLADSTDVYSALVETLKRHADGDPPVPIRLAAAVQMLRKMKKHKYWGGEALNKAFIKAEDLPKGRGITEPVQGSVLEVAAELADRGILKSKTSNGRPKYALNADRITEINAIMDLNLAALSQGLQRYLLKSDQTVSARELDASLAGWEEDQNAYEAMRAK